MKARNQQQADIIAGLIHKDKSRQQTTPNDEFAGLNKLFADLQEFIYQRAEEIKQELRANPNAYPKPPQQEITPIHKKWLEEVKAEQRAKEQKIKNKE